MRRKIASIFEFLSLCYAIAWFCVVTLPAFLIYAVSFGAFRLDIREGWAEPVVEIPGWSRNEITWFIRRPPFIHKLIDATASFRQPLVSSQEYEKRITTKKPRP